MQGVVAGEVPGQEPGGVSRAALSRTTWLEQSVCSEKQERSVSGTRVGVGTWVAPRSAEGSDAAGTVRRACSGQLGTRRRVAGPSRGRGRWGGPGGKCSRARDGEERTAPSSEGPVCVRGSHG